MFKRTKVHAGVLAALGGASLVGAMPAFAQQTDATPQAEQRVEITGSLIKRIDAETSLPVQVIARDQIEKLGVTTVEELLTTLTVNSAVGANTTAEGSGASTYGESNASLRGLGANKTLVLVNGRRLANYATDGTAVDINSIPLASVERVEILKDGASGVYGSDAVAGVINFILRKNFKGLEVTGYAGGTKDGGGGAFKGALTYGKGDFDSDRYNLLLSLDWAKDQAIYGSQRASYAGSAWDNVNGMFDESATPSGALRTFNPAPSPSNALLNQGSGLGNPLSPNNCTQNGSSYDPNIGTCRFNASPYVPLLPQVERQNVAGDLRVNLGNDQELYIEGFYSHTKTTVSEQPSPYSVSFFATDQAFATKNIYPAIILSPSSPYYPTAYLADTAAAGKPVTVSYRAFDGGGRVHVDDSDQVHFVTGLQGSLKGNDYDLSYVHNSSKVSESTLQGYQSMTALASLLSNNNQFNPFVQYQTPALAAQIYGTNYAGNMITSTLTTDAVEGKISGVLVKLPAGDLNYALGGALRDENMNFQPSSAFQIGDISGYGGQALPLQTSRHSSSIYGELEAPIIKSLEADLSVRRDQYPNATSTNPKLSLRFQPLKQVLLRASAGSGFREPSLPELYNPQTIGTSATFTDPVTGVKNQFTVLSGGNPNLQPEKSNQSSFGVVLEPINAVSLGIDYFNIKVKNLVTTLDPQFIVDQAAAGNPAYTGLVTRDPLQNITQIVATNLNAGSVETSGVDIDLKWRALKSESLGAFDVLLNGTYTSKFTETLPDGTVQPSVGATVDANGNPLNAVAAGGIIFRWRHDLALNWSKGDYELGLTQHFQTGYDDNIPDGDNPSTVPAHVGAFSTWDIQGAYKGVKNLVVRAGIKNMFDRKPPLAVTLGQYFQAGYDPTYYDPHGMAFYASATYKFW